MSVVAGAPKMDLLLHAYIRRTSPPRLAKRLASSPTTAKMMPQGFVAGPTDAQDAQTLMVRGVQSACQYAGRGRGGHRSLRVKPVLDHPDSF